MELSADVVVVGAGPAGAATALMLAPFHRVLLMDRAGESAPAAAGRIGESLPAAARRLFRDMGLLDAFLAEGHAPCHGTSSLWGGPAEVSAESIRNLDGPGWHLDRARFDRWLRRCAQTRGAAVVDRSRLVGAAAEDGRWRLRFVRDGRAMTVMVRFVVDAGGRAAPLARAMGHRRGKRDRLVCRWLHGTVTGGHGRSVVAAEPDGWWYTAALLESRQVLAFYTDADLPAARETSSASSLMRRARMQTGFGDVVGASGFAPISPAGYCAAHTSMTTASAGAGWLAVGDAALSCDPLSSQGLFNALYTAIMAADALGGALAGRTGTFDDYQRVIDRVAEAYSVHLAAWYAMERRWPGNRFWARRQAS